MPVVTGDTIYFGGWYYSPSVNVIVQHFQGAGGGPSVNYAVSGDATWRWIERTVTATGNSTSGYRLDNDTPDSTIYITGLTVRKNPSQTTGLPFTPRFSPHDGTGSVFTTQNIVAKEAAIRTLTGNVGIGTTSPAAKLQIQGTSEGAPPTSGGEGTSNGLFRLRDNFNVSLDIGTIGASPWTTWLQVADSSSMGGYYPLALQPNGGNVGIGTADPKASLHVNGNKAIINGQSSVQTVNVYKDAGGNSGAQTRRYYRVYVPNTYNNFQIIFRGFARNYSGGGDIQAWRRQYTIQRNSGHNIVITHNSGENIDATGFTFTTSQSGGTAGTIEVHFDVTFPAKPEAATYITFKADVIGDSGSFANTSGI